jgi:glyoxylase-like metal-dependent hydrolase (beta-lactamase superfamily II)
MIPHEAMIPLGAFELYLLNDATSFVDGGGAFGLVPRKLWSEYFPPDHDNLIQMSQHCLLVKAHDQYILIDTGLGDKMDDRARRFWNLQYEGGVQRGLAHLGIKPEQINLVINTHLHADHCSGNTRWRDDHKTVEPVFPNARYLVQRREYDDAMRPNERTRATYLPFNYDPLVESGHMRLIEGDIEVLPGIELCVTPGHTPHHMSVRLSSEGRHAAFLCDLATYAVHFERLGWMTAYDVEPLRTLETKRLWQTWALENDALLFFPHDFKRPAGRLKEQNTKLELITEDVPVLQV